MLSLVHFIGYLSNISAYMIVFLGLIAMFCVIIGLGWFLLDYFLRGTKFIWWLIQYVRYRKEFQYWHARNKQLIRHKFREEEGDLS